MAYKRALITGGAGLIGSHIADRLVAEGIEEIVVLDNLSRGRRQNLESAMASGRITFIEGDICDREVVARAMEGVDIVFQEAAIRITQCAENPRLAHEALQIEDKVGTMLPCNVVVQDVGGGRTEVAAIDPVASMQAIDNPRLKAAAERVQAKLKKIVDSL